MCFGLGVEKKNSGFTIIEVIMVLALFLVIIPPFITILKLSADKIVFYMDYRKAFDRTSRVVALLKAPVFYCGFGMPVSAERYKNVFCNLNFAPFDWNGPIESITGPSAYPNSELRIVYAQPARWKLDEPSNGVAFTGCVLLTETPEVSELPTSFSRNSTDLKRWLLFRGIVPPSLPLYITCAKGKNLIVENNISSHFSIPNGERPYVFRAMKVYCMNDRVYTRDFRASGEQPRVTGIQDMRFDVDMENKLITMYVLSRGDIVYACGQKIIGQESWPEEYIKPWKEKGSRYQMYAYKFVWRLPNCICENIISSESIEELF